MFKYELNQVVFYLQNNMTHSAPILSRMWIENAHEEWAHTPKQKEFFTRFGVGGKQYATCHGTYREEQLFSSKEELIKSCFFGGVSQTVLL